MSIEPEENLDDVIADLIDNDEDDVNRETKSPLLYGSDTENAASVEQSVALTERAAKQILKIKSDEQLDDGLYLRVAVEGGGCSGLSYKLGFDHKAEEDLIVISRGIEIVVDPRHMMYLSGISIDYPDGLDARGFTFDNPNATETCGCGSSFAT